MYRVFDNRSFKNAFLIYIWCAMAQISSSSLSPVIYAFLSPEFRTSLLKHGYFCCSRRMSTGGRQHCPLGRVEPVMSFDTDKSQRKIIRTSSFPRTYLVHVYFWSYFAGAEYRERLATSVRPLGTEIRHYFGSGQVEFVINYKY